MTAPRKAFRCEYPADDTDAACGKPATWTTDDLQDVAYLCDEHVNAALLSDTFVAEALS